MGTRPKPCGHGASWDKQCEDCIEIEMIYESYCEDGYPETMLGVVLALMCLVSLGVLIWVLVHL